MVTSGTYKVNYTNFITEFMNAMDLAFASSSICLKLFSRGPRAWSLRTQRLVIELSQIKEIHTKVYYRIAILQSQKAIALVSFIEKPESLEILLGC